MGNIKLWQLTTTVGMAACLATACTPGKSTSDPQYALQSPSVATIPASPLAGRIDTQAVWGKDSLLVWGGADKDLRALSPTDDNVDISDYTAFDDGAEYRPHNGTWERLPESPLPARSHHQATWTGEELMIWGGVTPQSFANGEAAVSDGAFYNPSTKTWRKIANAPAGGLSGARSVHVNGTIVTVGGYTNDNILNNDVLFYSIATNSWTVYTPKIPPIDVIVAGDSAVLIQQELNQITVEIMSADAKSVGRRTIPSDITIGDPNSLISAANSEMVVVAETTPDGGTLNIHKIFLNRDNFPAGYRYVQAEEPRNYAQKWYGSRRNVAVLVNESHLLIASNHAPFVVPIQPAVGETKVGKVSYLSDCNGTTAYAWGPNNLFAWSGKGCKNPELVSTGLHWNFAANTHLNQP